MAPPIRLGGIKLSGELVQLDLLESKENRGLLSNILKRISIANINIPHLHQSNNDGMIQTSLCIHHLDYSHFKSIAPEIIHEKHCRILPSVGTITLFPHKSSIDFVVLVYNLLNQEKIPIHGISTSVSALVIHTDFHFLETTTSLCLTVFELPENHSPFRPDYKLKQVERE